VGEPDRMTFMRSAAKPFQAMPLVGDGVVERYNITAEELALICASHNAEPRQVALVQGLLERIGLPETALVCGPHRPLTQTLAVWAPDETPPQTVDGGALTSNCSGKHTGMLALAKHHGWPTVGYELPGHPVQERCRAEVARWSDMRTELVEDGEDGCGVAAFCLPLSHMALAFAKLGASDDVAASTIRSAMVQHPDLVAGKGRLCTAVMLAYPGQVLAKVGADGVYGAAIPERRLGIAIKVADGHGHATMVALVAVLEQLGLDPSPSTVLARFAEFPRLNTRHRQVGTLRAAGSLTFD
jgi:L-asparaginase II